MATVSNFSDFRLRSIIETSFYGNNIIRINSLAEAYRLAVDSPGTIITDYKIKETKSKKSLATIFGEVTYKRTYYVHKITGEYKYLSDEAVGIEANDRMDILLESMLIEEAIETPYRSKADTF